MVELVQTLERSVCHCRDQLLSPGPHFTEGENQEVVEDSEEDSEEEEDGLKYETEEEPSDPSYTTPPSTGGRSSPSTCHPSCSPTPKGLDPENNTHLQTELIEAWVNAFLVEAEEDLELNNLPPLENSKPIPIQAPTIPRFVPFAMSTSQCCIPSKGLPCGTYHPYHNSIQG